MKSLNLNTATLDELRTYWQGVAKRAVEKTGKCHGVKLRYRVFRAVETTSPRIEDQDHPAIPMPIKTYKQLETAYRVAIRKNIHSLVG